MTYDNYIYLAVFVNFSYPLKKEIYFVASKFGIDALKFDNDKIEVE